MQHQYLQMTNSQKYTLKQYSRSCGRSSNLRGKIIVFEFASIEKTLEKEKRKPMATQR